MVKAGVQVSFTPWLNLTLKTKDCGSGRGDYQAPEIREEFFHVDVATSVDIFSLGDNSYPQFLILQG